MSEKRVPAEQTPTDEASELRRAARMSSAPADAAGALAAEPAVAQPSLGVTGWLRWFWRQLTSMRVALILLFLLSLAAVPGSLIPQQDKDPERVSEFLQAHHTLGPIYSRLGMFHVFSSPWFAAIYLLLFVSLAGCIIPRCVQFAKVLRTRPPSAPRNLRRLPAHTEWTTAATPEQVVAAAEKTLRGARFRAHRQQPGGRHPGLAVAAEKGYLREAGNLVFHLSLFGLLIGVAMGSLFGMQGGKLVVQGDGFTNVLSEYDSFTPGKLYDASDLKPFGFSLDSFDATYQLTGANKGTPHTFDAKVTYWSGANGTKHSGRIKVNHPLEIGGDKVFLIAHGYAPVVTVKDGQGNVAYQGAVPFLPQNALSGMATGVVKVPDAIGKNGKVDPLGFVGTFLPTAVATPMGMQSSFPAAKNPVLVLTAYHGNMGMNDGGPQNVYVLDTSKMKQFMASKSQPLSKAMKPGQSMALPNGAGSITFDGYKRWANFTIASNPGSSIALYAALLAILGLAASLFIRRRRVWVRAVAGPDGRTTVEMAGLGRSESSKLPEELAELALRLHADAPPDSNPDPAVPDARDAAETGTRQVAATSGGAASDTADKE